MKKNLFWSLTGVSADKSESVLSVETGSVVPVALDELAHVSGGGGDDPDGAGNGRPTHAIAQLMTM
jgi:hypothetical protein